MAFQTVKRLIIGRPMHSERLGHTLLPKKIALPVFASDADRPRRRGVLGSTCWVIEAS